MTGQGKKISIGIPVRNGQHHIRDAIDSIIKQTYQNFELIISDNASTDETAAICQQYAAADPRIKYYRQPENIGAAANFNRTFQLAEGAYFKWAAHDDVLEPTYLEQCVAALQRNPDAVLCQSLVKIINDQGQCLHTYNHAAFGTDSPRASERFAARLTPRYCMDVFGLIRSDALRRTGLIRYHLGSDRTLLVELALLGRFLLVPEFLFLNREHPRRFKRQYRHPRSELGWYAPSKAGRNLQDSWRMLRTWVFYLKSLRLVRRHVAERSERMRCYGHLAWSVRLHQRWLYLMLEPLMVFDPRLGVLAKSVIRSLRRKAPYASQASKV
jgi:glycosyltransferase involved in cell wall biosynthesis